MTGLCLLLVKYYLQLYTIVRNVKQAHECQDLGENQQIDDDLEFLLDGLEPTAPTSGRYLSAISLAQKCTNATFRYFNFYLLLWYFTLSLYHIHSYCSPLSIISIYIHIYLKFSLSLALFCAFSSSLSPSSRQPLQYIHVCSVTMLILYLSGCIYVLKTP